MEIGFVASIRGKNLYNNYYQTIITHLEKKGHNVHHILHLTDEEVLAMSMEQRDNMFHEFYRTLLEMDIIVVDCSFASINIGYRMSFLLSKGKALIVLHEKESEVAKRFEVFNTQREEDNLLTYEYEEDTLPAILDNALHDINLKLEKRYTIILPSPLFAKLEHLSQSKKIPKAVYIRELLEKSLKNS